MGLCMCCESRFRGPRCPYYLICPEKLAEVPKRRQVSTVPLGISSLRFIADFLVYLSVCLLALPARWGKNITNAIDDALNITIACHEFFVFYYGYSEPRQFDKAS